MLRFAVSFILTKLQAFQKIIFIWCQFLTTPLFFKGNQGGGLHWEHGGRADEVDVLVAFSNFLDILTEFSIFYEIIKFRACSALLGH